MSGVSVRVLGWEDGGKWELGIDTAREIICVLRIQFSSFILNHLFILRCFLTGIYLSMLIMQKA